LAKDSVKILHTADWHLGSDFQSFADSAVREALKDRQAGIFSELRRAVDEKAVDLVLIGGDLFDKPDPSRLLTDWVRSQLSDLPCPVLLVAGNHDPFMVASHWENPWPSNVKIAPADCLQTFDYEDLGVRVFAQSFADIYERQSLLNPEAIVTDPKYPISILLVHGDIDRESGRSDYNPIPLESLRGKGLNYVALGHIHKAQEASLGYDEALWAYPGFPQGRGFDELGPGFFRIGTFSPGLAGKVRQTWENFPLETGRFLIREVDITAAKTQDDVHAIIDEALATWQESVSYKLEDQVIRLLLIGKPDLAYGLDLSLYKTTSEGRKYFYIELKDRTRPPFDPDHLLRLPGFGQTLVQVLQSYEARVRTPEDREKLDRALDTILRAQERVQHED
jgi:exonuclease SbcD